MLYLPSICYTRPSKGGTGQPQSRREHAMTDITANEFNAPIYSLIERAELDMSWVTEYQVVEDPYKGEDERDFEHFDI